MSHIVDGHGGAHHTFSEEEKQAFSEHINICLGNDPDLKVLLPLNPESTDLFEKTKDGRILCKLINLANHDAIDERAINKKENMNVYHKTENQNLALNAAKSIGCQIINIGAQDLINGNPILILGLVWQVIKIQLLSQISLKNFPELVLLLNEGETLEDFIKLHPEIILLRWLNYHLKNSYDKLSAENAGSYPPFKKVTNFSSDLHDSSVYLHVLSQLNPSVCPLRPYNSTSLQDRASQVIRSSSSLGVNVFIKPADIVNGNKKLNTSLVAQLFNTCHGLVLQEEVEEVKMLREFQDFSLNDSNNAEEAREEKFFRMWINSLNIENLIITNLYSDLSDGYNLLLIIHRINNQIVNWKRVNKNPTSRYKKIENCNYVVELCKNDLLLSVINIGGLDIVDRNKKIILAIVWQLMRKYIMILLKELSIKNEKEVNEDQIIAWSNEKVKQSDRFTQFQNQFPKERFHMRNFKDTNMKSSLFYLELLYAIEPRAIDWEMVQEPKDSPLTDEELLLNAKYTISVARKIGACIFILPEDILEIKSRMLLTFLASLWMADLTYHAQ